MSLQMKRPAATQAASEPKARKQPVDPLVAKCDAILQVLGTAEGFPEATLQMLAVGVRTCLTVPKETRHEVQNSVIEMIGEVLNSVEAGHAAQVEALRSKIAEADTEKVAREASAEAAAAVAKEKSEAVGAAEEALKEAKTATEATKEAQRTAISEQKVGDADLLKADEKKASAEAVVSADLALLKDGAAADTGKSVENLTRVGKELGLEAQLLQSAVLVLRKAPAERGSFDSMVTQQIDEQFSAAIAKLADQLANGESYKAERASKVEACNTQVDAAAAHGEACREQLVAAKATQKEAELALKAAETAVKQFGPEMEKATANAEAADALLVACRADLAIFTELVEGPPAAPEAAAVEEGEAATAEDAPPAASLDATAA